MEQVAAGKLVVLTGLPGSGKTTIGRQLARRLQVPFADTDQVIEDKLGCRIRDFFAREGEEAFRAVEQTVLASMVQGSPGVLATGGGIVLREGNRQCLRQSGATVVYLRTSVDELARRLRHDAQRPLLQVEDPVARLHALMAARDPLYREVAHHVVDSARRSASMVVSAITEVLGSRTDP